jgi:hypothetical protein
MAQALVWKAKRYEVHMPCKRPGTTVAGILHSHIKNVQELIYKKRSFTA